MHGSGSESLALRHIETGFHAKASIQGSATESGEHEGFELSALA